MSNTLLRQSLEFVDGEDKKLKRKKPQKLSPIEQRSYKVNKSKNKKKLVLKTSTEKIEQNLKKLQYLSNQPEGTFQEKDKEKILERALKGKPSQDKILLDTGKDTETAFTEEDFQKFEKEYFCN